MTDDQRVRLFSVYYLARYNRDVALALGARAQRRDTFAAGLVVLAMIGSLVAGGLTFKGSDQLQPLWAGLNILATGFAIWALIMSYSQKKIEHYELARRFEAHMLRVETFSGYAARTSGVTPDQIDQKAVELREECTQLMDRAGSEHRHYSDKHEQALETRLNTALRREGRL